MSLHRALSIFVVTGTLLAVGAGISLVLLAAYLHRATVELHSGLHGVRLAEEMQIDLLTYVRTSDEPERDRIENNLREKLQQARQYGETPREDRSLAEVERLLDGYFADEHAKTAASTGTLRTAFRALKQFVDANIEQANAALSESERLDELGRRIGIGVAVVLIIGAAAMMFWLHAVAFRPVFEIQNAMKAFAGGQKDARAATHGPEEFRTIATQFNEMAHAITRQHQNQTAFLAAIAHDLRNPIGALKMSAEILSGPDATPERLAALMAVIKRQVGSLDRMVADLLDSAKIESGHLELKFEELDARTLARDAFDLFKSASPGHEFALTLPETPVPIRCDRLRIEQVLNNLLSNAIKYSPAGGRVTLGLKESVKERVFQVADQGMGIAREDVPYIFEPFRRVRRTKADIPGVGLGLSVARRIVNAHGGHIAVETEVAKGTTFSVYLPAVPGVENNQAA